MRNIGILIAGGGLAGLSTAYHLNDRPFLLAETEDRVGGLVKSEILQGCTFDITGHWLHLRNDYTRGLVRDLLQDNLVEVSRNALIFAHKRYVNYPFQSNLADLPPDIAAYCAKEAVRSALNQARGQNEKPRTFREFALAHFGAGITREFIEPYNAKLWGVGIDKVTSEWCDRFVPVPDVMQIVGGAVQRNGQSMGYNATFLYPRTGGMESLPKALAARLPTGKIRLNAPLRAVKPKKHQALVNDEWVEYDALVSTLPLPVFARMVEEPGLWKYADMLRASRLVYAVGAVHGAPLINGAHWLYLPARETPIYRFGVPSNVLPGLAPEGMSSFYAEFTPTFNGGVSQAGDEIKRLLSELGRKPEDLAFLEFRTSPFGYVIFDRYRNRAMKALSDFIGKHDIFSIGRFGAWTYNAMEDALLDGRDTARHIKGETDGI